MPLTGTQFRKGSFVISFLLMSYRRHLFSDLNIVQISLIENQGGSSLGSVLRADADSGCVRSDMAADAE